MPRPTASPGPCHSAVAAPFVSRQGNPQLNWLLHHVALVQARSVAPARAYLARRQQEGRTAREARRALKRHHSRRVWHQWQACWAPTAAASQGM